MLPGETISLWRLSSLIALLLLVLIVGMLSLVPLRGSHDEWWHLKSGKYIDEHGLPENDIFTYTAEDVPWHNHEWLAQIGLWRTYRFGVRHDLGGVRAVVMAKGFYLILAYLAFAVFLGRKSGLPAVAALSVAVAAALARRTMYFRPPFISYGLMALVLCLLIAWRERRIRGAWLLVLPPLFAVWANLHGGFMAGLVVGGAFWLESLVAWGLARWRAEATEESRRRFLWITAVGLASFAGTLATPYGIHLYALVGRVLGDPRLEGIIYEMLPANWRFVWVVDAAACIMLFAAVRPRRIRGLILTAVGAAAIFFALQPAVWLWADRADLHNVVAPWEGWLRPLIVYSVFLIAAARSKERVGLAQMVLLLFFTQQGINHVRHLPLMGIALAPVMAQTLADWSREWVLSWDALLRRGRRHFASTAELWEAAGARTMQVAQWVALAAVAWMAGFYALLPEEAIGLVSGERPFAERLEARGLIDRNRLLLEGQPEAWGVFNEPGTEPGAFPKLAVDFLLQRALPGRLFTGGNYAGYLMWRLAPERYRVFTDNRYDIYGGDFIQQEKIVLEAFEGDPAAGIPSWREIIEHWDIGTLFVPRASGIHRTLLAEQAAGRTDWLLVYDNPADPQFVIWVKRAKLATRAIASGSDSGRRG